MVLYENQNYVPMGFTYDYYLTEAQYEDTVTPTRSNLLMRALVLTEEDAVAYGQYLTPLPTAELNDLTYTRYTQDCADRRASACTAFEMTSAGFHAEATLDRTNLMFFSVPYDDGFTAYVDGQETEILAGGRGPDGRPLPRRNGHHRLCLSAGRHPPEPDCHPCRLPVFLLYAGHFAWDRKEKTEAKKAAAPRSDSSKKSSNERRYPMGPWYYEVVSFDGDYVNLRRTDIESDELNPVALGPAAARDRGGQQGQVRVFSV